MAEEKPRIAMVRPTKDKSAGAQTLRILEKKYRIYPEAEIIPYARNTSFVEIAENVVPDRDGPYAHPLYLFTSRHSTTIGVRTLARKTKEFLEKKREEQSLDILSVSAGIDEERLMVVALVRVYGEKPRFAELSGYLGEKKENGEGKRNGPRLLIPPGSYRVISEEERTEHERALRRQKRQLDLATEEYPFLNCIEKYVPVRLSEIDERQEMVYDLRTRDMQIQLNESYDDFIAIFNECMDYITSTEKDTYYNVLKGQTEKRDFFDVVEAYVQRAFIATRRLPREDLPALMGKIDRALFELYIVQDLIDDPLITDIKITDPDSIRVRIKGKAYLSNITFIDDDDMIVPDYLKILHENGIPTGIITSEDTQIVARRAAKLSVDYLRQGKRDGGKRAVAQQICDEMGITMQQVAYIGDDLNCYDILSAVGFPACPSDACAKVRNIPGIRLLSRKGGDAVVREFAEQLFPELFE